MAAPSAGHPVTVTLGVALRLRLKPSPPRSPRLSVAATVQCAVLIGTRVAFGVLYYRECPQQPVIPKFLLGLALLHLIVVQFLTLPCETHQAENPRGFKALLLGVTNISLFILIVAGDWWVFSVYQPNYDPAATDGLYCNKTLYTFALWNAVGETLRLVAILAQICTGLLCCVTMSPAPTNGNFHSNV